MGADRSRRLNCGLVICASESSHPLKVHSRQHKARTRRAECVEVCAWGSACLAGDALPAGSQHARAGAGPVYRRAGARLRSRSSSGQADRMAVVCIWVLLLVSLTTRPLKRRLTVQNKNIAPPSNNAKRAGSCMFFQFLETGDTGATYNGWRLKRSGRCADTRRGQRGRCLCFQPIWAPNLFFYPVFCVCAAETGRWNLSCLCIPGFCLSLWRAR